MDAFETANQKTHHVENEWHFPTMTLYGYVPVTKTQTGFVRHYDYSHPTLDHKVTCSTGASSDHWQDNQGHFGFWSTLETHLVAAGARRTI